MKSNYILISFILLFGGHSFAQEKNIEKFNSIITFSLFSPIVNYAPRWNLGYIRKIDNRYWLGIELGYGSKNISVNFAEERGWIKNNYKLFEIKPEIYYDLIPKSEVKNLLSLELQYVIHTDKFNNSWYYDLNDNNYYKYDSANYKRFKYGININYNLIYNISNNLAIMQKVGIGYRKRVVEYSNIVNRIKDENFEEPDTFIIPDGNGFLRDNGNLGGFNFNLNVNIIYSL